MISTTGIWNHTAGHGASPTLAPMDSSGDGSGSSTAGSATISANDFLTLLVTEMQNQDPTADTDPNEYINQLVNVNSLEQLISINQTLSTAFAGSTGSGDSSGNGSSGSSSTGTNPGGDALGAAGAPPLDALSAGNGRTRTTIPSMAQPGSSSGAQPSSFHLAPGNLSIPNTNPSAERVAQSLSGH